MAVIESPLRTPVEKVITLCSLFTAPLRLEMVGSLTKELAKVTFGGRTDSFVYDTRVPVRRGETRTRRKGGGTKTWCGKERQVSKARKEKSRG